MAEAFLKSLYPESEVFSAGTEPAPVVHPKAVKVMKEVGIDISDHEPESVDNYIEESFDYVITVCDDARENCPVFTGNVKHRLHIGFRDPASATGTREEIMDVFRRVRDEIKSEMKNLQGTWSKGHGIE
jgi:arsenate reductase